jgi:hypothetical protein
VGTYGFGWLWVKQAPSGSATNIRITTNDTGAYNTGYSTEVALTNSWQLISVPYRYPYSALYFIIGAVTVSGSLDSSCYGNVLIAFAGFGVGTYESAPRSGDLALGPTGGLALFGPAFDHVLGTSVLLGYRHEAGATNLYVNSGAPATQTITVVDGTTYTGSIRDTGTLAFTGAFTASLSGVANTVIQSANVAATTTSLVATDTGLASTSYPQVEVGLFATSPIITGAASVTRAPDFVALTGVLATFAPTNPVVVEVQSEITGLISRMLYAKNFAFQPYYWYRKLWVFPVNTPQQVLNATLIKNNITNANSGIVAGSPGTIPTGWSENDSNVTGLSQTVVGSGVENGVPYWDVQITGTFTGTGQWEFQYLPGSVAANVNQIWSVGFYVKVQSGSLANVPVVFTQLDETASGGSYLDTCLINNFLPTTTALNVQNYEGVGTTINSSTARISPSVGLYGANTGSPVNVTLRIGALTLYRLY